MSDPYELERFVAAQRPLFSRVMAELEAGQKRSHWMWFVFPQIAGLGHSPMAQRYAIGSLDEARAYVAHDVLGPRLRVVTELVLRTRDRSIGAIFGQPDDMKFRSSMTLFAQAVPGDVFDAAIAAFFGGEADAATIAQLRRSNG
jgi:uncharacterized protein (DUF1810 family)